MTEHNVTPDEMTKYVLCEKTVLDNIANSIRSKMSSSDNMNLKDFSINIDNIPKGENVTISYSNQYLKFYYLNFLETGELVSNIIDFLSNSTIHSDKILVAKNSIFIIQVGTGNSVGNLYYSGFDVLSTSNNIIILKVIGQGDIGQRSFAATPPDPI